MLPPSLDKKLQHLVRRYQELERLLSDADVVSDQARFQKLSKEYARLEGVTNCYQRYCANQEAMREAEAMQQESDAAMRALAEEEAGALKQEQEALAHELMAALLPKDPFDERNVFLEIRAGTGGQEAALFAGDLLRMYMRYAETRGWRVSVVSQNASETGGYKEVVVLVQGDNVYARLKFESGVHRVQRVPATESQGRLHTSACTVAVMPEVEMVESVDVRTQDLRVDTFRASGAGGQHVNRTDSAVRLTHLPTGLVVECQDERSQHKNKARALSVLQARLLDREQSQQRAEEAETRKKLVGSGDRSERIRTYNFPQGRVTDHRIQLTLYALSEVIDGRLDMVIEPLSRELQTEQLTALQEERGDDAHS